MKALSVNNVNKHFREPVDFHVLKDISFSVNQGEFVSIIGKSGSGKSTLLYLLSTMDTDYQGEINIAGKDVSTMSQNQLAKFRNEHIGFVFQFHFDEIQPLLVGFIHFCSSIAVSGINALQIL